MSNGKRLLMAFGDYKEYFEQDSDDPRKCIMHIVEDCEPIVQAAKMLSELEPGKDFRHAAIIPRHVLDRALREGWFRDKQKWKDWANNPDNRAFRTWPGQL